MKKSLNVMLLATAVAVSGNLAGMETPAATSRPESQPKAPISQIPGDKDIGLDPSWVIDPSLVPEEKQEAPAETENKEEEPPAETENKEEEEKANKESEEKEHEEERGENIDGEEKHSDDDVAKDEEIESDTAIQAAFRSAYDSSSDGEEVFNKFKSFRSDTEEQDDFLSLYSCIEKGLQDWEDKSDAVKAAGGLLNVHEHFISQSREIQSLKKDNSNAASRLEELQQEADESREKVKNLEEDAEVLKGKIEALKTEKTQNEQEIKNLEESTRALNEKIGALETEKTQNEQKIKDLEQENSKQKERADRVEKDRANIDELGKSLEQRQTEIDEASSQLEEERQSLSTLRDELFRQEETLTKLRDDLKLKKRALESQESELMERKTKVESARLDYNEKVKLFSTESAKLASEKLDFTKKQNELAEKEAEISQREDQVKNDREWLENAQKTIDEKSKEREQEFENREAKLADMMNELSEIVGEQLSKESKDIDRDLETLSSAAHYVRRAYDFVDDGLTKMIEEAASDDIVQEEEEEAEDLNDENVLPLKIASRKGFFRFADGLPTSWEEAAEQRRKVIADRMMGCISGKKEISNIETFFEKLKSVSGKRKRVDQKDEKFLRDLYKTFSDDVRSHMLEVEIVGEENNSDGSEVFFPANNSNIGDAFSFLESLYNRKQEARGDDFDTLSVISQLNIEPLAIDDNNNDNYYYKGEDGKFSEEEERQEFSEEEERQEFNEKEESTELELPWQIERVESPELVTRFFKVRNILQRRGDEIASLQKNNQNLGASLKEAIDRRDQVQNELNNIKSENDDLNKKIDKHESAIASMEGEKEALSTELEQAKEKIQQLSSRKKDYKSRYLEQKDQINALKKEISGLKETLGESLLENNRLNNTQKEKSLSELTLSELNSNDESGVQKRTIRQPNKERSEGLNESKSKKVSSNLEDVDLGTSKRSDPKETSQRILRDPKAIDQAQSSRKVRHKAKQDNLASGQEQFSEKEFDTAHRKQKALNNEEDSLASDQRQFSEAKVVARKKRRALNNEKDSGQEQFSEHKKQKALNDDEDEVRRQFAASTRVARPRPSIGGFFDEEEASRLFKESEESRNRALKEEFSRSNKNQSGKGGKK